MLNIQSGTISRCHNYLDKMGKINQHSVQRLPQEVKDFLRNATPARLKELAKMNCFAADKIKQELDNKYGENNYVIISLGRSLSSICELMKFLGVEVKHMPMSGLRRTDIEGLDINNNSMIKFKKYLKSIGLTKEELEKNPDKKYILIDYTYYGRTLDKCYNFLKRTDILGEKENFIKMPVYEVLKEDYKQKAFDKLFEYTRFKDYAEVGKLSIQKLSQIFTKANPEKNPDYQGNITKGVRKLFWFNVFDILKSGEYRNNFFPQLEIDALYKHFLSPRAVQNYLKSEIAKMNNTVNSLEKK